MELTTKSDRMGKDKIRHLLFTLSVPAIIGMFVQSLYNIVDSIYVGRLSTEALSALSLCFPVQILLIAVAVGTGVGTSSLISRLLGQRKVERAGIVAEHVFFIAILYGLIVGVIGFFFSEQIVHLFTDNTMLIDMAKRYIRIIMIGSLTIFIPAIFNYILRGEGNTFAPMITMLIGAVLNIILDPFLIFGIGIFPKLGIEGAAIATVTSRLISGLFITHILLSDRNEVTLRLKDFGLDWHIIRGIYQVGLPAMAGRLLMSCAMIAINRILGSFNITAIAVMGVVFRLQSFFLMSIFGLTQGYLPLVGYNYGHEKPERMKRTVFLGSLAALSLGALGLILFQSFPEFLLRLFNRDPEFIKIGITALRRVSLAYIFMSLNIMGAATFQAIGRGLPSLILSLMRQFFLLLSSMYFLGQVFGLEATWFAFPIAEATTFILLSLWLSLTLKKCFYNICQRSEFET
jgi:putative MATE family efflux protein